MADPLEFHCLWFAVINWRTRLHFELELVELGCLFGDLVHESGARWKMTWWMRGRDQRVFLDVLPEDLTEIYFKMLSVECVWPRTRMSAVIPPSLRWRRLYFGKLLNGFGNFFVQAIGLPLRNMHEIVWCCRMVHGSCVPVPIDAVLDLRWDLESPLKWGNRRLLVGFLNCLN